MQLTPLLTIAIPTFNRARYLDLNLRCLGSELENLPEASRGLINLYISNNASTDDTPSVIEKHRGIPVNLFTVVNQAANIGPDANIVECYRSAKTPYVWVFGDDDVILSGGIKLVLECLARQDVDLVYVGSYGFYDHHLHRPKTRAEKRGTIFHEDGVKFAKLMNNFAFISSVIARTGISTDIGDVLDRSNLRHLGWVFPLLRDGRRFAYIRNWAMAGKMANSGGYGIVDVFGVQLQNIAKLIFRSRPRLIEVIENGAIVHFFPSAIMRQLRNKEGRFTETNLAEGLGRCFNQNWRYRLFLVPLIHLPFVVARAYYFLISAFLRLFPRVLL